MLVRIQPVVQWMTALSMGGFQGPLVQWQYVPLQKGRRWFDSGWARQMSKQGGSQHVKKGFKESHYKLNSDYYKQKTREKRKQIQKLLREYKDTVSCVDCGIKDNRIIDFDHIDDNKDDAISTLVTKGFSWENILLEIRKCEPVCANCHRIRTHTRRMTS